MKKFLYDYFKLSEKNTDIKTELLAGLTTFLAMAYILAVNASVLSTEGTGMDFKAVLTATAIAAIVGTLIMGLVANFPIALAPGMGINAFFTYTIIFTFGFTWQQALAATFVAGIIFLLLSLSGVREAVINAIPNDLKYAIGGGIGLFIAYIGLKHSGLIVLKSTHPELSLLGEGATQFDPILALIGLAITAVLYIRKFKGAIFYGIIATSVIGMFLGNVPLPTDIFAWPAPPPFGAFLEGFKGLGDVGYIEFGIVVFSLLFVDFFDTAGTLVSVGEAADLLDENGILKDSSKALLADSTATVVGAIVGTSSTTSFIESLAGIEAGGRTGLTAVSTAFFFFIFLFLSPLLSVITDAVTAPALIFVGVLMAGQLKRIEWEKIEIAFPAFITLIFMPLTFSIANGIAFGFVAYTLSMVAAGKAKKISPLMWGLTAVFFVYFYTLL